MAVLLLSLPASAQTATASLQGTVVDPTGAVIPSASVTVSNPARGFSRTTKTDGSGSYSFPQLPPATYALTVQAEGFAVTKQELRLPVSTPTTANIELQLEKVTTQVEVTAGAAPINLQDASIGNPFTAQQLILLPSEGRDPVSVLSLQPGVTYLGNTDPSTDSRTGAVSGGRSDQANITIDGVDDNEQLRGEAFHGVLRATLDSVQEFRVTTTNANADFGRSSGAQVVLVTKSGTNGFHGSVYEYNRPTVTAANDWFNKQAQLAAGLPNRPPKMIRNTFGGTFGGPVVRDRVFFFVAYEGQRKAESQQVTRIVPSADLRNGILHYLDTAGNLVTLTPADVASMDPNCTGNGTCPLGPGANPSVMTVFKTYPMPNTDTVGDGLNLRGYTFAGANPASLNTAIARLDLSLTRSGNHRLFLRGNYQEDSSALPAQFPGQPANITSSGKNRGFVAGYTALLSPMMVNNFRYGYIRESVGNAGLGTTNYVWFYGLSDPIGTTRTLRFNVPVHNFVDDVTWTRGKHTFQFGGNLRLIHNNRASDGQNQLWAVTNFWQLDNGRIANSGSSLDPAAFGFPAVAGSFSASYDTATAALTGLLPWVFGYFNQDKSGAVVSQDTLVPRHFKAWEAEFYAQDSWRLRPNLTLTAGVRYTLLQPPYEANGEQVAPIFSMDQWFHNRGAAMAQGKTYSEPITIDLSGQANGRRPFWGWDYGDVAPRVAIAWSPNWNQGFLRRLSGGPGKMSIRAGYGIYYDHFGQGVVNAYDRLGSYGLTTLVATDGGIQDVDCTARFTAFHQIPGGSYCGQNLTPTPPGPFPLTPPQGYASGSFQVTWGLDDKLRTPYSQVFSLSVQRELPGGLVIESAYVGRLGRRLLQQLDLAMPLDIVDPASRMDYFTAATLLSQAAERGTNINALAPIPYWEHLFPGAAGGPLPNLSCAPGTHTGPYTATQNIYDMYSCFLHNEVSGLVMLDRYCFPACMSVNGVQTPFQFFDDQYASMAAWTSIGNSSYHAWQLMLRKRSGWAQFDVNYTLSRSIDEASDAERNSIGEWVWSSGIVVNSWSPHQLRGPSDFDARHQINANWVVQLPWGQTRRYHMSDTMNGFLGNWDFSGVFRWTSGFPFSVGPGVSGDPTNIHYPGNVFLVGNSGPTGTFIQADGAPNLFADPAAALGAFRFAYPGEAGQRNNLRGPGYFELDTGLGKTWMIGESRSLAFRWETFNLTNSVRFDAKTASTGLTDGQAFGKFNRTTTLPRVMQFSLRFNF